jgi:hypothetical protein
MRPSLTDYKILIDPFGHGKKHCTTEAQAVLQVWNEEQFTVFLCDITLCLRRGEIGVILM